MRKGKALLGAGLAVWLAFAGIGAGAPAASASAPYEAYTYNYYADAVPLPAPYLPERAVTGDSLGVGPFNQPNDVFVTRDGTVYVLDTGNNRIVVLDRDWNVLREITSFTRNGAADGFARPEGLFVTERKEIVVADTGNRRIVVLDHDGKLLRIVENPQSDILPANFQFNPVKVTADRVGRLFVVARGVYEGLMQFDENGQFIGYAGTIRVQASLADRIWRWLATEEQRKRMQLFIPTEFSNVDIDDKGFVYATTIDVNSRETIKRLNPSGEDVIKRFGYYPNMGDIVFRQFGNDAGPSMFVDIKVLDGGIYVALDAKRARLFAYNDEGELLYAFGGRGSQLGLFNTPVAVERIGDRLIVLDRGKNTIVEFRPTKFGRLVHEATRLHYEGRNDEAVELWKQVIELNSNYDIAYIGVGKSLLMQKKNEEAMEYFKLGMQRKYYSIAYKRFRREEMQEYFGAFMTVFMGLIVAFIAWRIARKAGWRRSGRHEAGIS